MSKANCATTSTPARTASKNTAPTSSPTRCRCSAAVAKAAVVGWAAIARSVRRRVSRAAVAGRVVADMVAVVRTTRRVVSSRPSSSRRRPWTISQTTISRSEDCPSLCHPRGPALRGPSALWELPPQDVGWFVSMVARASRALCVLGGRHAVRAAPIAGLRVTHAAWARRPCVGQARDVQLAAAA
ncbi:hypothetical protein XFF6991_360069 [Xanthomonas phaseoli pv. phaseoli]|uniref:Uncharacterized protein n=1 Tax=Xanthomonas campestris pv. phaseoli TaxID=317013 RepID=A0A7Z7IZE7_XANCH|nr:hypothetical protein XFF6991_360069 [Xanthomonas phaseoli pv. phaseoli]